jgi:hypothetical protein
MYNHPNFARKSQMQESTPITKVDVWDGRGTHAQFTKGIIYDIERANNPDRYKLKLPKDVVLDSDLPTDCTGYECYCTDSKDRTYGQATLTKSSTRSRHGYWYMPQETARGPTIP